MWHVSMWHTLAETWPSFEMLDKWQETQPEAQRQRQTDRWTIAYCLSSDFPNQWLPCVWKVCSDDEQLKRILCPPPPFHTHHCCCSYAASFLSIKWMFSMSTNQSQKQLPLPTKHAHDMITGHQDQLTHCKHKTHSSCECYGLVSSESFYWVTSHKEDVPGSKSKNLWLTLCSTKGFEKVLKVIFKSTIVMVFFRSMWFFGLKTRICWFCLPMCCFKNTVTCLLDILRVLVSGTCTRGKLLVFFVGACFTHTCCALTACRNLFCPIFLHLGNCWCCRECN